LIDAATLDALATLTRQAGAAVMAVYASAFDVSNKGDDSPVTLADVQAEAIIVAGLKALAPEIPIVAEEAMAAGDAPQIGRRFWLVDPLDGTREFVGRNGEFTVNIALVEDGAPVLGVVFAPAIDRLFAGQVGQGGFVEDAGVRRPLGCRWPPPEGLVLLASRSHGDEAALRAFMARDLVDEKVARVAYAGSSLKLCLIAAGEADIYPRFGRTMEWDIAAGHAVLAAAGGSVNTLDGQALRYGKAGFENPHFCARGRRSRA
jgi:3'(2'), 5'-bisphosphate nucleotidase